MNSPLTLYSALCALFVFLWGVIAFNFAVWGLHRQPTLPVWHVANASPDRGRALIRQHGCGACHIVPGVHGAVGVVGPRLDRLRERIYVAGVFPHTPENLTFWIAHPKQADPLTAMPDLDVCETDARHIAAYLYQHP